MEVGAGEDRGDEAEAVGSEGEAEDGASRDRIVLNASDTRTF